MDYNSSQVANYQFEESNTRNYQELASLVKDGRERNSENYNYSWTVKATYTNTDKEGVDHEAEKFIRVFQEGKIYAKKFIERMSVKANKGCYVDMGILYGDWVCENAIIWWPEPVSLDKAKIDAFLTNFFDQLKKDGISNIKYAFDQLSDIFKIIDHEAGVNTDTISSIYVDNYLVQGTEQNFLEYMTSFGLENGITSTLSFGGSLAGSIEMTLQEDGVTSANTLANFMKKAKISSIDYDIEGEAVAASIDPNNLIFYEKIKALLNIDGGTVSVTVIGDINQFPKPFLSDFDSYFDNINLMLYSNSNYYIDATGSLYTWSLDKWIEAVGNDPSKISIGFYDSIAYEDPASSAGKQYNVEGLLRGEAAAAIYLQVAKDLGITINNFAPPFWWTDNPVALSSDTTLEDFYKYLKMDAIKKYKRKCPPYKRKKFPIRHCN